MKCIYCNKEFSPKGIGTHIWRVHGEGKKHNPNIGFKKGTRQIWNKGLTKETDERVLNICKSIRHDGFQGKHHNNNTKLILSEKLSKNNKGGRCKWYEIEKTNGELVKVQGTWESRFAAVLNIIDENWIKPGVGNKKHTFQWIDENNEIHYYTPDFFSPKLNKYFEVKGYWWGEDRNKMKLVLLQNNIRIEIITKSELLKYEKLIK